MELAKVPVIVSWFHFSFCPIPLPSPHRSCCFQEHSLVNVPPAESPLRDCFRGSPSETKLKAQRGWVIYRRWHSRSWDVRCGARIGTWLVTFRTALRSTKFPDLLMGVCWHSLPLRELWLFHPHAYPFSYQRGRKMHRMLNLMAWIQFLSFLFLSCVPCIHACLQILLTSWQAASPNM